MPYVMASVIADKPTGLVIECARAIPFRLTVVDDAGAAVDGTIEYYPLKPNPHYDRLLPPGGTSFPNSIAHSLAARRGPGVYEGYVIPGPGTILVGAASPTGYRQAQVDPKAFFEPGRTNWTDQERYTTYGHPGMLSTAMLSSIRQSDHEAILLINPSVDAPPLELTATLLRDRPIPITLVDAKGQPVVGAEASGLTTDPAGPNSRESQFPLRTASFALRRLPIGSHRRITFQHEDRRLIGFLMPDAGDAGPRKVLMKPWATLTGRLLDEEGQPLTTPDDNLPRADRPVMLDMTVAFRFTRLDDPTVGGFPSINLDADGRFRVERLVPGQRYTTEVYRGMAMDAGPAFEDVVLAPGEVRDLGDITTRKPVNVRGR